jgi:surface antigen
MPGFAPPQQKGVDMWGFFIGQCTDWVAQKVGGLPSGLGNAGQWLDNAPKYGINTTSNPQAGDTAVWRSNTNGAKSAGHTAYVEQVYNNGTMKVSEMNWGPNNVGVTDTRIIPISSGSTPQGGPPSGFLQTSKGPHNATNPLFPGGINIPNPVDALNQGIGNAISAATTNALGFGATISIYLIIAVLAIGLVLIGIVIMTKSKPQGEV